MKEKREQCRVCVEKDDINSSDPFLMSRARGDSLIVEEQTAQHTQDYDREKNKEERWMTPQQN